MLSSIIAETGFEEFEKMVVPTYVIFQQLFIIDMHKSCHYCHHSGMETF